jgi:hypothetical protein
VPDTVRTIRAKLDPVIDGEGRLIEAARLFHRHLEKVGGRSLLEAYRCELREHPTNSCGNRENWRHARRAWWGVTRTFSPERPWKGPSQTGRVTRRRDNCPGRERSHRAGRRYHMHLTRPIFGVAGSSVWRALEAPARRI